MDLLDRIDGWARLTPGRAAHISAGSVLTYHELTEQSNILAAYLTRDLPDDNSPVAILGHKQNEMLVGFLGCVKARHPYVPLDSSLPEHRVDTIMDTARASLLLTPEKISEIVKQNVPAPAQVRKPGPQDAWYIIFTSGSTGDPKGVVITRECLEDFVDWILGEQNFKEGQEVYLNQAPFSFDLSVMDLYSSLATGGTLFSITKEEIAELKALYQAFPKSQITVWVSTPSFARMCLMDPAFNASMLAGVRKFWFCGETLAPEVAANLIQRFPRAEVWNTYGPTEATVATSSIQITAEIIAKYSPLPVGRPKPGTQIVVQDENGKRISGEGRGEVIIAGPNVSTGYIHRPDLSLRAFFELNGLRAYHTGDAGHFKDGLLFFDGRMDFQIKLHGYRIEIGDIEANLNALANVQDAVVIAAMKDGQADHLVAFIIFKETSGASDFESMKQMKKELGERLPEYMVPRKFVFLNEFPITPNGKADRRKLADTLQ